MMKFLAWVGLLAIDIPLVIYRGFVLSILWLWFVVPLGVVPIGKAWAIGLSLLVGMVTKNQFVNESDDDDESGLSKAAVRMIAMAFSLTITWLAASGFHSLM